jgi:hypothetical protein
MKPRPLKKFHQAKEHLEIFGKVDEYLQTYRDNSRRRAVQIHRQWEDHWMKPFQDAMKRKLNGEPYSDFVRVKTRAKTELKPCGTTTGLGSGPVYNALTEAEAVDLPYVKIPTTGTDDRIHKYQEHAQRESELARIVNESHGIVDDGPEPKERVTFDVQVWKILPETRIYTDSRPDTVRKGRRPYAAILQSRIAEELDQF